MTDTKQQEELRREVDQLGENLKRLGRRAWESQERRELQSGIQATLREIELKVQDAGREFRRSETGQRLSQDIERIKERFESGEMQRQARGELASLINKLNDELDGWLRTADENDDSSAARGGNS